MDTGHSAAGFSVKHLLVSTVRGTLGPVKGTIEYDGKSLDSLKADITIDVTGVNTGTEGRDKDLKSPNFFDVAQFPTATFKSKRAVADGAGKFKLIGDLTMHGVTKEVTLNVEGPVARPEAGQRVAEDRRVRDDDDQPQGFRHAVEPDGRGRTRRQRRRAGHDRPGTEQRGRPRRPSSNHAYPRGFAPSDSPTRALGRRFAGSLRSARLARRRSLGRLRRAVYEIPSSHALGAASPLENDSLGKGLAL